MPTGTDFPYFVRKICANTEIRFMPFRVRITKKKKKKKKKRLQKEIMTGADKLIEGNSNITLYQGFWTYLYFRIRHSFAHVWTILNKMAAFGVIAHVRTILNKMASFGVNIYRSSALEHGQNITNITTI